MSWLQSVHFEKVSLTTDEMIQIFRENSSWLLSDVENRGIYQKQALQWPGSGFHVKGWGRGGGGCVAVCSRSVRVVDHGEKGT